MMFDETLVYGYEPFGTRTGLAHHCNHVTAYSPAGSASRLCGPMSCSRIRRRARSRMRGRPVQNMRAAARQIPPPMTTALGAPRWSATKPAHKEPNGAIPRSEEHTSELQSLRHL